MATFTASLPSAELLQAQASWLAPVRAGLLRRARIAHCQQVLDLGAGRGAVSPELVRRSSGAVYALDLDISGLREIPSAPPVLRIVGSAGDLPLANKTLDLTFSQFTFLWLRQTEICIGEIWRTLKPGGRFCAIEPDYEALIEHPPQISLKDVWLDALSRAGAVCDVGRRLPALLEEHGFEVEVRLLDQLAPPSPLRFAILRELTLTASELAQAAAAEEIGSRLPGWQQLSHLPLFIILATRPHEAVG